LQENLKNKFCKTHFYCMRPG